MSTTELQSIRSVSGSYHDFPEQHISRVGNRLHETAVCPTSVDLFCVLFLTHTHTHPQPSNEVCGINFCVHQGVPGGPHSSFPIGDLHSTRCRVPGRRWVTPLLCCSLTRRSPTGAAAGHCTQLATEHEPLSQPYRERPVHTRQSCNFQPFLLQETNIIRGSFYKERLPLLASVGFFRRRVDCAGLVARMLFVVGWRTEKLTAILLLLATHSHFCAKTITTIRNKKHRLFFFWQKMSLSRRAVNFVHFGAASILLDMCV